MADDDLGLIPAGRRAASDDLGLIPAGNPSAASQPPAPSSSGISGFLSTFAPTAAISAAKKYLIDVPLAEGNKAMDAYHSGDYAGAVAHTIGSTPGAGLIGDAIQGAVDMGHRAYADYQSGHPILAAKDVALGAVPMAGPMSQQISDHLLDPSARSQGVGELAGLAASAGLSAFSPSEAIQGARTVAPKAMAAVDKGTQAVMDKVNPSDPHTLVMSALRPSKNTFQFKNNLNRAMPDIKAAESDLGRPIQSVDDLIGDGSGTPGAIQIAKAANRKAYNSLFPNGGVGVDLSPVADSMEQSITKKMALENPAKAQAIRNTASKYRGMFNVEDVGDLLKDANGELDSYYGKNPAARKSAAGSNPDIAATVSQAEALRKALYKSLDAEGQGEAARELQRRWGALNDVENAAMDRRNVMLRAAPQNVAQQFSKIGAAMKGVGGLGKMATVPFGGGAAQFASGASDIGQALAGTAMGDFLRKYNSTDDILRRAFNGYDKAPSAVQMPDPFRPAGLLEAGPIRMPGAPDASGPIPNAGPYMGRGMSPDIGSRLLSAPAGPIRYHGGVADASGPIPGGPRPGSGISPDIGTRRLSAASSVQTPGFSAAAEDLVPVKNQATGQIDYIPKWMADEQAIKSAERDAMFRRLIMTKQ